MLGEAGVHSVGCGRDHKMPKLGLPELARVVCLLRDEVSGTLCLVRQVQGSGAVAPREGEMQLLCQKCRFPLGENCPSTSKPHREEWVSRIGGSGFDSQLQLQLQFQLPADVAPGRQW